MILPGISGSFILVLLGAYSAVIGALKGSTSSASPRLPAARWAGCLGSARALAGSSVGTAPGPRPAQWIPRRLFAQALALKENLELLFTHSDGRPECLQANISPAAHPDSQLAMAALCAVAGVVLVTGLSRLGQRPNHG